MARNAGATASKSHRFLAKVPSPRHRVPSVPAFPKMRVQAATRTFTDVPCHGAPHCGHCLEPVTGAQWRRKLSFGPCLECPNCAIADFGDGAAS